MNQTRASFCVILAGILWGMISVFVRRLNFAGYTSLQISFCRVLISGILLTGFLWVKDRELLKIRLRDIWCFIGTGVISLTLFNACYFTTITLSQASIAVVLLYTSPIFVTLFSALLFKEALTSMKLAALGMTFLGCVLVSGIAGGGYTVSGKILLMGIASGVFYALYSIFGRYALRRYDPFTVTVYTFWFAVIGTGVTGDLRGLYKNVTLAPSSLLWAVGIALVCTILPYILYTTGLAHMESGKAAILVTVEPLVGAVIGICFYGESHDFGKMAGMALIFLAVIVLNLGTKEKG